MDAPKGAWFKKKKWDIADFRPLSDWTLAPLYWTLHQKIHEYQGLEKTYTGALLLGATTPSYDLETAIDQHYPWDHIQPKMVQDCIENSKERFFKNLLYFRLLKRRKALV